MIKDRHFRQEDKRCINLHHSLTLNFALDGGSQGGFQSLSTSGAGGQLAGVSHRELFSVEIGCFSLDNVRLASDGSTFSPSVPLLYPSASVRARHDPGHSTLSPFSRRIGLREEEDDILNITSSREIGQISKQPQASKDREEA